MKRDAPAKNARPLAGRRVLVVEDEFFLADDIAQTLCEAGAEVIGPIARVAKALEILANGQAVDAAILDLDVRGEKSFPIADILRARHVPHLFQTGYDPDAIPELYRDTPRCEKPYDVSALPELLCKLLG
jgi:CheY-like chemotaxis protein